MKKAEKKLKVCFAASSGGHFEQLMMLNPLMDKYDSFILTEKTDYEVNTKNYTTYFLKQINRKEKLWILNMLQIILKSFFVFLTERPEVVVCTGVLAMIPMCLICKLFRKKVIYIESFAKSESPTETGKLLYKFADNFYVQWKKMLDIFPKASYLGGIY